MAITGTDLVILVGIVIIAIILLYLLCNDIYKLMCLETLPRATRTLIDRSLPLKNYGSKSEEILHFLRNDVLTGCRIYLSVIIPAYNDGSGLQDMLQDCFHYLESRCKYQRYFTYEVIIVDNVSSDETKEIALYFSYEYGPNKCKVIPMHRHRDVVFAIFLGIVSARGRIVLCADADGTTKFSNVTKLEERLQSLVATNPKSFVIGVYPQELNSLDFSYKDAILNLLLDFIGIKFVQQKCGFTLFTFEAALSLVPFINNEFQAFYTNLLNSLSLNRDIGYNSMFLD